MVTEEERERDRIRVRLKTKKKGFIEGICREGGKTRNRVKVMAEGVRVHGKGKEDQQE